MLKQSKIHDPLIENMQDWPIARLSRNRPEFINSLIQESMEYYQGLSTHTLKDALTKTIFLERIRVAEEPWKVDPPKEGAYWSKMRSEIFQVDQSYHDQEIRDIYLNQIREIITHYAEEIVGTFKESSFRFARKFLTFFFNRLLNAAANRKIGRLFGSKFRVRDKIKAYGPIDKIRSLFTKGTVVVVPTHFSNIDSILVGYAMDTILGLPSFSYGAGLNLLNNGAVAYYINRMGAYRVDRRKKNPLYLHTLKQFSKLSIERGVNSLFFPGGTRSRSGELENNLKMGLLGTVVNAQKSLLMQSDQKKIYVVPVVMSYHFVLEAKYMIDQHLRKSGKEQYFKSKDQSYSIRKSLKFFWQLFSSSSEIKLSFGEPLDVIGNFINDSGQSVQSNGEILNLEDYFSMGGKIVNDEQRDQVYTRKLAKTIVERYHKENIVLGSHLVAFTLFHLIRRQHKDLGIYDFLRLRPGDFEFELDEFVRKAGLIKKELLKLAKADEVKLANDFYQETTEIMVRKGIKSVGEYHDKRPVQLTKRREIVRTEDLNLLLFYSNRLEHYGLERFLADEPIQIERRVREMEKV